MLAFISVSLLVGLPTLCLALWIKNSKFRNAVNKFPGPAPAPIVGNIFQLGKEGSDVYRQLVKWSEQFKEGVFLIWLGDVPVLNVYKPELLECVMSTSNSKKSIMYNLLVPWLHNGLLMSHGQKWQKRRKMLTPTFHYSILEDFMSVFHCEADKLVRILAEKSAKEEFDIYPYITRSALEIICSTAMGVDLSTHESQHEYIGALHREAELLFTRLKSLWAFNDPIYNITAAGREQVRVLKVLHGFTRKVIENRWKEYEGKLERGEKIECEEFDCFGKKKRKAFLDLLILNSISDQSMTIDDIQEEVDTFMFEGHDTTSSAIAWSIYNLGRHIEWQEKIRDEILHHSNDNGTLTAKEISDLTLLDCFLKESIRLFTTVPFISREITDECKIGPYDCPKGVTVQVLISVLHRDPRYFPDPDRFDPERWMRDDITKRHPFCYVPFSSGLRNCIGQKFAMLEWKIIVINLVKNFKISCEHDFEDIKDQSGELILRPTKGLPVRLNKIL